ncbi:MAG: bifunctional tRNA pseudouridine(32) synthase/23S rRNA pseudouridine(746) synthase RluA [Rhodobacteraceae bacterium]|nr:bifunctional tRNA pseudouridine(32) synthase/23S rRNA pseudouridine(746) synthase RluA [Paracoccaceae bacterium]
MSREFIYAPSDDPIEIIHEDEALLIVNKPSGLLSVPGRLEEHKDSLETRLRNIYPDTLLVHRLDVPTSGVMVFARTKAAQRHIGMQFEKRQTRKTYVARVWGHMAEDSGHIDLPLIVDWPNKPRQKVCHETGKASQTDWVVLEREVEATRVRLHPTTGRTHQLRVHMMAIGHSILGDRFYADDAALMAADRLQLHAEGLMLRHPAGGAEMTFRSEVPF